MTTTSKNSFWPTYQAVVYGGLLAGALDLAAAVVVNLPRGISPLSVMQSIASGLLGRAAFTGGTATAALGVALHFAMMLIIAGIFVFASRRLVWLIQRPWFSGPGYGVAVYFFMGLLVVPLSAAPFAIAMEPARLAVGLLVHVLCVGLPIAFVAKRYS